MDIDSSAFGQGDGKTSGFSAHVLGFNISKAWLQAGLHVISDGPWNHGWSKCRTRKAEVTRELFFDNKDILPAWCFCTEVLVDSKVLVLQGKQLIPLHISDD